jgi:hypothetical protein
LQIEEATILTVIVSIFNEFSPITGSRRIARVVVWLGVQYHLILSENFKLLSQLIRRKLHGRKRDTPSFGTMTSNEYGAEVFVSDITLATIHPQFI